jgi:hypothetical protein
MAAEPGKTANVDAAEKGKALSEGQRAVPPAMEDADDPDFDDLDGEIEHTLPYCRAFLTCERRA